MEPNHASEFHAQPENNQDRPQGYRRPPRNRKRRKALGRFSLFMSLLALLLLIAMGVYGALGLYRGTLSGTDLKLLIPGVILIIVIAGLSVLTALLCFFLRKQKKGTAITGLILSVLVIGICAFALYSYNFVFSGLSHDQEFNELQEEELNAVTVGNDGEVDRSSRETLETISQEAFEEKYKDKEISFDQLQDPDLPEEALECFRIDPSGVSYLHEGYEQISNYLLLGIDYTGACDAILILTVDRYHHKLKLTSIPRDTYVLIPEWNCHKKLAYTYHWGGAQMTVSTINYNFFLNISDYVAVNLDQLGAIIDYVGGVTVNLDWAEAHYLRGTQSSLNYGDCLLYGEAAVMYARIRKSDSNDTEIKRQGRQREVLNSLMQSAMKMPISDYPGLIRECLSLCTTSFNAEELLEMAVDVLQGSYKLETDYAVINEVNYWGGYLDGDFFCVYDMHFASDRLYKIIYEDLYESAYPEVSDEVETTEPPTVARPNRRKKGL